MPKAVIRIMAVMLIWLGACAPALAIGEQLIANPEIEIDSIDRSSPESLLKSFLTVAEKASLHAEAREWARRFYNAWFYPSMTEKELAETNLTVRHMLHSLDLSDYPGWQQPRAGTETALMLYEILKAKGITANTPLRQLRDGLWVIPRTYLQIGKITQGVRAGDYVFDAATVDSALALYQTTVEAELAHTFSPYTYVSVTPGGLLAPSWAGITHRLPEFLRIRLGENTVFQWGLAVVVVVMLFAIPYFMGRIFPQGRFHWIAHALLWAFLSWLAKFILIEQGDMSGRAADIIDILFLAVFYGSTAGAVLIAGDWLGSSFAVPGERKSIKLNNDITHMLARVLAIVVALGIVIRGVSEAGVPVFGIMAGFGVGGLAVALAIKPTLENVLAGVVLFFDDSIRVGDALATPTLSGTVVEIGLRSTKLRGNDGAIITVTNSDLSNNVLSNRSPRLVEGTGDHTGTAA